MILKSQEVILFATPTTPKILGDFPLRGDDFILVAEYGLSCTWRIWYEHIDCARCQGTKSGYSKL